MYLHCNCIFSELFDKACNFVTVGRQRVGNWRVFPERAREARKETAQEESEINREQQYMYFSKNKVFLVMICNCFQFDLSGNIVGTTEGCGGEAEGEARQGLCSSR